MIHIAAAKHEVAPWIEVFARIGFVAKGVLYMTISALAVSAALGRGGKTDPDSHNAMREVFSAPFGRVMVGIIAFGLLGYAAWRVVEAITDPERRGHGAKAFAIRASYLVRGLVHLALAAAAASLAIHEHAKGGGGGRIKEATAKALATPGGVFAVWAVAIALAGYGVYQLYRAYKASAKKLHLEAASHALVTISRIGIAARGIACGTIAVLLARAARDHDAREAGGVGDSLRELATSLGKWPYLAIALGLGAYGSTSSSTPAIAASTSHETGLDSVSVIAESPPDGWFSKRVEPAGLFSSSPHQMRA